MNCQQCDDFENETKALMTKMFGNDEISFMVVLLAKNIVTDLANMKRPGVKDAQKMFMQASADFSSAMIGKFLISLDESKKDQILQMLQREMKLTLNIKQGACPHGAA